MIKQVLLGGQLGGQHVSNKGMLQPIEGVHAHVCPVSSYIGLKNPCIPLWKHEKMGTDHVCGRAGGIKATTESAQKA
jgi:hypothetical protein